MSKELPGFSADFLVHTPERELPPVSEEEREWQAKFFFGPGAYLKNELGGMMAFVEMAADEVVESENLRKALEQFTDFRAYYFTREDLLISLQEKGSCERTPLRIRAIWRGVREILKPELLNRVECEIAEPEEEFSFDLRQMSWAVAELVRNSVEVVKRKRFSEGERGRVGVVLALEKEGLKISVADNGEGMDEKVSEGLSHPQVRKFIKDDALAGKVFAGPGLGLAIARRAVNNHKGGITFKSNKGEGSIFTITIR